MVANKFLLAMSSVFIISYLTGCTFFLQKKVKKEFVSIEADRLRDNIDGAADCLAVARGGVQAAQQEIKQIERDINSSREGDQKSQKFSEDFANAIIAEKKAAFDDRERKRKEAEAWLAKAVANALKEAKEYVVRARASKKKLLGELNGFVTSSEEVQLSTLFQQLHVIEWELAWWGKSPKSDDVSESAKREWKAVRDVVEKFQDWRGSQPRPSVASGTTDSNDYLVFNLVVQALGALSHLDVENIEEGFYLLRWARKVIPKDAFYQEELIYLNGSVGAFLTFRAVSKGAPVASKVAANWDDVTSYCRELDSFLGWKKYPKLTVDAAREECTSMLAQRPSP